MSWCPLADTTRPLARHRARYGRETPTAGRGACRRDWEHVLALQFCRRRSASFTDATGSVHLGVVTATTAARRAIRGGRAVAGPRVPRHRRSQTPRSRPAAAGRPSDQLDLQRRGISAGPPSRPQPAPWRHQPQLAAHWLVSLSSMSASAAAAVPSKQSSIPTSTPARPRRRRPGPRP